MSDEIRIPDVEVLVGAGNNEVALFCFWGREDIHQGYDITVAVSSEDARQVVRQILQDCLTTLAQATWVDGNGGNLKDVAVEGEPPF